MIILNQIKKVAVAVTLIFASTASLAEEPYQYFPLQSYRIGAQAAGGSGFFSGFIDYMKLINIRDGGVNGVKLTWDECETEYKVEKGVECYERMRTQKNVAAFNPFSVGIQIAMLDRATKDKFPVITIGHGLSGTSDGRVFPYFFPLLLNYMDQESARFNYLAEREGGAENLRGKKIVLLYHGSPFGREPVPFDQKLAKKYGIDLIPLEVPHPGNDQNSQWLQIRRIKPDYVLMRGWGVMNAVAITGASRIGFPVDKLIGNIWANSEEDVRPAGAAAKGYISTIFHSAGSEFPVIQAVKNVVYGAGKGDLRDPKRLGTVYHNLGVVNGILNVEAVRIAQEKFGKRPLSGEEVRWGFENLVIDDKRIAELGATGLLQPIHITCSDHEGAGAVKFQQWDGTKWNSITGWIKPDRKLTIKELRKASEKYASEHNIALRNCEE